MGGFSVIDADVHIIEPADTWTARMSKARWGNLVPHVRHDADENADYWYVGEARLASVGHTCAQRGPSGELERTSGYEMPKRYEDVHPSAYDAAARVRVMDSDGIGVAVLYPDIGLRVTPRINSGMRSRGTRLGEDDTTGIIGSAEDTVAYSREIVRAYNDFVADWASVAPERFVKLISIPFWDVPGSVEEIERCAALGFKGVITTGAPQAHGQPFLADRHWDPIWSVAQANGLSVSFHIGGGDTSIHRNADRMKVEGALQMAARVPAAVCFDNAQVLGDLLMSGILPRFPELQFVNVESGVGWVQFCLESLDYHFNEFKVWQEYPEFNMLPSEFFRRQVYATYFFENLTAMDLSWVGTDRILFETDYPHPSCLFGDSITSALEGLNAVPEAVREGIVFGNAARLYGLETPTSGSV